jgi:hypothetical protein
MGGMRQRIAIPAAILLGLVAVPALAGCSGNPVQNVVKNATGGKVDIGGTSVPSDFPREIPLYKGSVDSADAIGGAKDRIWNVTIRAADGSVLNGIKRGLAAAGFTVELEGPKGKAGATLIADDAKYGVLIALVTSGKHDEVNYTVTTKDISD